MKKESMIELAYTILSESKEPVAFKELWDRIKADLEIGPDEEASRIGHFYTDLSLDGRFIQDGDYTWNLRSRTKLDQTHIDTSVFYDNEEAETAGKDEVDAGEDAAYDAAMEGRSIDTDGVESEDDEEPHKQETAADFGLKV